MRTDQLVARGMSKAALARAVKAGRLHPRHPGVYSTVPPSLMRLENHLAAAILAGGEGAVLCGPSAAHHAGLAKRPPRIDVAVRGARRPAEGVRWRRLSLSEEDRIQFRRFPITRLERIPLDLAATASLRELKRVLAELEYHHGIGPEAVLLRRGVDGSARLRTAIAQHTPQLAETLSELERTLIHFLDARCFQLGECNRRVELATVDMLYRQQGVVIELDGVKGHSGARRVLRDHRRDLHRRADGLLTLRYAYGQLVQDGDLVEADLVRAGVPRLASWT